jgi:two-component system, OmpR family, alkaline phosphatase synthesis response regulator PhoP
MRKRVLVCDDHPYILEAVCRVVDKAGYSYLTATDGNEALQLARTERPSLMILDVSMPKKDGNAVCRELKSDVATRGIYIIMLTARGQEREMQESVECGVDEYIAKPFSPRKLAERLQQVLG